LYDPASNTWSAAGTLAASRYFHTATLLPSGKVLVTGGWNGSSDVISPELYDPSSNNWSVAIAPTTARTFHTATLLPSGKVLVAGGWATNGAALYSAELYDPASNAWSAAGTMATARGGHTATLLPSGKVLVVDGILLSAPSAELYDPGSNTWSAAGTPATKRYGHTATLLPSGQVLIVGGNNGANVAINSAELYDPVSNTWSAAGTLATARYSHTATLLPSGQVLVARGWNGGALNSAELCDPGLAPIASLQPTLDSVFLSATNALTGSTLGSTYLASGQVVTTGFMPRREAGGGSTNSSATNAPVFQVQRIDNDQMHFIAQDENVDATDTGFAASTTAFAGFPPGPMQVRVWVNGIPSAAAYVRLVANDVVFHDGFESDPQL
jgi:hypothetical protein